jgi:hypothetical protein
MCGCVLKLEVQRRPALAELGDYLRVYPELLGAPHDSIVGGERLGLQRNHPMQDGQEALIAFQRRWLALDGGGIKCGVDARLRHREKGSSLSGKELTGVLAHPQTLPSPLRSETDTYRS